MAVNWTGIQVILLELELTGHPIPDLCGSGKLQAKAAERPAETSYIISMLQRASLVATLCQQHARLLVSSRQHRHDEKETRRETE